MLQMQSLQIPLTNILTTSSTIFFTIGLPRASKSIFPRAIKSLLFAHKMFSQTDVRNISKIKINFCEKTNKWRGVTVLMHQSIPAVPIPPRATAWHFLTLSVPGVGHSQFYRGPGGWALAYPGARPWHLTDVFSKLQISLS